MIPVSEGDIQPKASDEFSIHNAGLVLCNPFLLRMFSLVELTTGNRFKDDKCRERAVLLLQYMLFGSITASGYELVLNKLLCGLEIEASVNRSIEFNQKEKDMVQQMLDGVIRNWCKLGNTSVDVLRDSFLIRDGNLKQEEDGWYLKVEQKGYDVLLDSLPWSFSPVKYAWMDKPLYVTWR